MQHVAACQAVIIQLQQKLGTQCAQEGRSLFDRALPSALCKVVLISFELYLKGQASYQQRGVQCQGLLPGGSSSNSSPLSHDCTHPDPPRANNPPPSMQDRVMVSHLKCFPGNRRVVQHIIGVGPVFSICCAVGFPNVPALPVHLVATHQPRPPEHHRQDCGETADKGQRTVGVPFGVPF